MPKTLNIDLTANERKELIEMRDTHAKPHMRERATAILKIAAGESGRQVALNGLLKKRKPETLYEWVRRWREEGIEGLYIREGRGRKPAYSP